ncbi:hypothetical protein EDB95_2884 [Dinghuibacter silviterrae]|uniref:TerB family tellurite resistance protein n=1 Tax=Dinghuibacter silviterrae TaxID=1539049 RepID=A0A4R8DXA1_9BACT|nr:hypothetical protein EDB95_2884 [Dinghuibacter silviterrae]
MALGFYAETAPAQSFEMQQLTLDIAKLSQLKTILKDMYTYYFILYNGYEDVKGIAKGNFDLHKAFLSGLLAVSDAVSGDPKVQAILSDEATLLHLYGSLLGKWQTDPHLTPSEVNRLTTLAGDVLDACTEDLDELTMVLTDNTLRMSDDERLTAVNHIQRDLHERLTYLRNLDVTVANLSSERESRAANAQILQKLYGQ